MATENTFSALATLLPADITAQFHGDIPITSAMAFTVTSWDGKTLTLAAPLAPNQNHADTAFGGSISSIGILAGYGLLYVLLRERNLSTRILIQKSATEYLRPVDTDLIATATCPDVPQLEEFLETIKRKRKARLSLDSHIFSGPSLAATHTGLYIAMIY